MVDRYRVWLGAGVLAGGVSAAMLAGAGVAVADDGSQASSGAQASTGSGDSDAGSKSQSVTKKRSGKAATTSGTSGAGASQGAGKDETTKPDSTKPDETKPDETKPDGTKIVETKPETEPDDTTIVDVTPESAPPGEGTVDTETATAPVDAPVVDKEVDDSPAAAAPVSTPVSGDPGVPPVGLPIVDEFAFETPSTLVTNIDTNLSHDASVVMRAAAADVPWLNNASPEWLAFINNIGTFVYDLYASVVHSVVGAVHAPFGSTVRVERSKLTIGNGFVVDADWYFPMTSNPKGIIYLQHGYLATASFYSATAAYLAEKTQSIVVAPTLTWGSYDSAKYPIVLPSTHLAIAQLFAGDRTELTASARAAGYTKALPTRVVMAGHSAGGGLAVGAARYMVDLGAGNRLAGVLMMDGVSYLDFMSSDLARIPLSVPVYNIGGQPYNWNTFGDTNLRLAKARPGMFTGVVMANGLHSDSMQSTNGLIQFATNLFTGFSSPWNIASNQTFAAGWIKDMFSGKKTVRLYGAPGSTLNVLGWWFTPKGQVVTGTPPQLTLADTLYACVLNPTSAICTGARL